jgi:polygalacturonase
MRGVTLSGAGCIDGNATAWFEPQADAQGYRQPKTRRPRLVVFESCEQVRISNITLYDSPMWTAHLVSCNHVFIRNLTIDNDLALSNTDALDIDSCQHVHISDSYFSAADDGICLKTTAKAPELQQPVYNVTVNNCIIRSKSCAIKVGTETHADIRNIAVNNCVIFESNRGIGLVSRDGGAFSQMVFSNILFDCRHGDPCHWGKPIRSLSPCATARRMSGQVISVKSPSPASMAWARALSIFTAKYPMPFPVSPSVE